MMQMPQIIASMINDEVAAEDRESSVLLQSGFGGSQSLLHMPTDEELDEESSLMQVPQLPEEQQDAEASVSLSFDEPDHEEVQQQKDEEPSAMLQVGCEQTLDVAVSDGHALLQMPDFKRLDAMNQEASADGTEGAVMFQSTATMDTMDSSLLASGVSEEASVESVLLAPEL